MPDPPRVLILTIAGDHHAYAVAAALRRKGAVVDLWHTSDFPSRATESVLFEGNGMEIDARGPGFRLPERQPTAVWNRRMLTLVDEQLLHEADRKFAELESKVFRKSFLNLLARDAFWVNRPDAAGLAECKPVQHRAAVDVDLDTPATLYGNDPEEIRSFIGRHGGTVVYKGLVPSPWTDGEKVWMPYTSKLRDSDLPDDEILRCTPGIYQEILEKDHELRVTILGDRVFAIKLFSQETTSGRLDWRRSYRELEMRPHELDPEVSSKCHALLKQLGLVFGCFDFVVTPAGRHVFLEVNQMGQFLFVERHAGVPLLDAFSELLRQGRPDFEWDPNRAEVFYSPEMEQEVIVAAEEARDQHVPAPPPVWRE